VSDEPRAEGEPAAAPIRSAGDRVFGLALFAVALVPRLWVALAWSGEPVWDGHYYDFGARRIAEGHGYSDDLVLGGQTIWHPWCHYPVGYSAVLAAFYRLFGESHVVAGVANALIGAALALVTWLLAHEALSPLRAKLGGAIVALHPGLILYAALVMTEPLAALLTFVAFWVAVRDANPRRGALSAAVFLGLAALVRPQALLCAPFLGAMIPVKTHVQRVGAIVLACALCLVPIAPWTARNCHVMDGCALVSTNGGWNLAIGAFPRATGRFETLRSSDGCREVTGQVQQDRCWFAYGMQAITSDPLRWIGLVPKKLGFTFDHESFAVQYLHEARPGDWPDDRREWMRALTTMVHRVLLCIAALGCVAIRYKGRPAVVQGALLACLLATAVWGATSGSPTFWPLAVAASVIPWLPFAGAPPWPWGLRLPLALLGTTVLTHAVFFGEDRYHVVVTPVLALLAAGAFRTGPAREPAS
jgi:4-amino-4-deoxy-L-arabinose transferase-like glycosyltransferase